MTKYKTLEERIIDSYLIQSSPTFVEKTTSNLSKKNQRLLFDFTKNVYKTLKETPELLFKELHEDDAHPNRFNCSSYNKPKLKINMRKSIKSINDFMFTVYSFGLNDNQENIPKKYFPLLKAIGIMDHNEILELNEIRECLNIFIGKEKLPFLNFIKCMYNEEHEYFIELFKLYSVDTISYDKLIKWLKKNKYIYIGLNDISEIKNNEGCGMGLYKYINNEIDKMPFSMYSHNNIGIFMEYSVLIQKPIIFSLRVQNIRKILEKFNDIDEVLKEFIIKHHARCNNCNYCIQRHLKKNKDIKTFAKIVEHNSKKHSLCPIHYIYTYNWNYVDNELVDGIIAYLKLMEKEHGIE